MAKNAAAEAEAAAEGKEEQESKSKKAPKPDGFVSPYEFATLLSEHVGKDIRPQTVYGFIRNETKNADGTVFPNEKNTDGKRMVNTKAALAWYDQRQTDKAAKAAAKEAEAEAEAEAE